MIAFVAISCSSDNANGCRLVSVKSKTLTYDQITGTVSYNPDYLGKIKFQYNSQNQIVKTIGGPYTYNDGSGQNNIRFSNDLENNISYQGNKIIAEDRFDLDHPKTVEFTFGNGVLTHKKEITTYSNNSTYVVDYEYIYNTNLIEEKLNNEPYRLFYFEAGNLIRVEQLLYNINHEVIGRYDLVFSEYDTSENQIKDMFFIKGNFYKAFSTNNHKREDRRYYNYVNGEFVLDSQNGSSFVLESTDDLFEQECD
jgi:hypothetical protein